MTPDKYSKCLVWGRLTSGVVTVVDVVVPAGVSWIISSMDFSCNCPNSMHFTVQVDHVVIPAGYTSSSLRLFGYNGPGASVGIPVQWRGQQTLEAGNHLAIFMGSFDSSSYELDISISGFELPLP